MDKKKIIVKSHFISFFSSIAICLVLIFIAILVDIALNNGPMSGLAWVPMCFALPIICGLSLIPLFLISSLAELFRNYFEKRLRWYYSTPLFLLAIFTLSFVIAYLLGYKGFLFIWKFSLFIALVVSIYACIYWLILLYLNDLFDHDQ